MKPIQWMIGVLDRFGLEKPDGRALYQYRLSTNEFKELGELLRFTAQFGIKDVPRILMWDAAFVIYGAEWWRREYSGQWGWEGIFNSLGISYEDLSTSKRNHLIETGLRRWRRDVRSDNGTRKFLGTVATEGGLPLHQLTEGGGWLKVILQAVLKKHLASGISLSVLIETYEDVIPKSYRSSELKQILVDIVSSVVVLRDEYQLAGKSSPVQILDDKLPSWREGFPIPVDDDTGNTLLTELVDTVSRTTATDQSKSAFEIDRVIIGVDGAAPDLVAQMDFPEFIALEKLELSEGDKDIPLMMNFDVVNKKGDHWVGCRGVLTTYKGNRGFKLSGKSLKLTGAHATNELMISASSMGQAMFEREIENGDALEMDTPWVFRMADGRWRVAGVASFAVKDDEAIIFLPGASNYSVEDNAPVQELSQLFDGKLVKLSGEMECTVEDVKYKLSVGKNESVIQYHLRGKKADLVSTPPDLYIGKPELVSKNIITGEIKKVSSSNIIAKPVGVQTGWVSYENMEAGIHEIRCLDTGQNILFRKRVAVFDEEFSWVLNVSDDVKSGQIVFKGLGEAEVSVLAAGIETKQQRDNEMLTLSLGSTVQPPEKVQIEILPSGQKKDIIIDLPFPARGAALYDEKGLQRPFSEQLFISGLAGYRIKLFDDVARSNNLAWLEISLIDSQMKHSDLRDLKVYQKLYPAGLVSEFSVYEWRPYIESLFSVAASIDAVVKVAMIVNGTQLFSLNFLRYRNELSAKWDEGVVQLDDNVICALNHDELANMSVTALNLNQPSQKEVELSPRESQGIHTGVWNFHPEKRLNGPWLIYPSNASAVLFRPILWNVGEVLDLDVDDLELIDTLPKAILVSNESDRFAAIDHLLELMANELEHKSWGYISDLYSKTAHLPLITLDLWKRAVLNQKFLAALIVKQHVTLLDQMSEELPVAWELISVDEWIDVLSDEKTNLGGVLDDNEIVNEIIEKRISQIQALSSSMDSIAMILRKRLLDQNPPELVPFSMGLEVVPVPAISPELERIFRRTGHGEHWPTVLEDRIGELFECLPEEVKRFLNGKLNHKYQSSVILLPIVLAYISAVPEKNDWILSLVDIFKVKQVRDFDSDWFSLVFNYLLGWFYCHRDQE